MKYKVPQLEPYVGQEELDNLKKCIEAAWLTEGPFAGEFLQKLKDFTGAEYAVLSNNGTLALFMSLLALGIKEGDEVIVPDFSFSASASSVVFAGAKPVFVDILDSDLNIDPAKIEGAITSKTKAIMPVHVYGCSADMGSVMDISKKHGLKVIEDAAQGYGVYYKGTHAGTIGDIGMISFFADKTITTGEGAVILTNNEELYEKLKLLRNQGRPNSGTFVHPALGMNFRLTDLQCAVGAAQVDKFKEIEKIKSGHFNRYAEQLKDLKEISILKSNEYSNFVPFRVNVRARNLSGLIDHLEKNAIQTRRFFYPLHRQPYLSHFEYNNDDFPETNRAYEEGLSLPVFCSLKNEQIDYLCGSIKDFYSTRRP